MKLHLKILIEPQLKDSPINLSIFDGNGSTKGLRLINDSVQTIEYRGELNYLSLPDSIKLCSFGGFVPLLNQRIIIKELVINDRPVESSSFFDLLDFFVKDEGFTSDRLIKKCHEVCLDGDLLLSVSDNKGRLFWCPYYFSDKKDDFVFANMLLDDFGSAVRTHLRDTRNSVKKYRNSPHHDYRVDHVYDFAFFGCSVTYGTALETKNVWPNLLSENSLNFAVPGLGVDGVFLNLKNSLKKFQFNKIIILLPNFERRIVRFRMPSVNGFCRIPIYGSALDWHHSRIKHWAWEMMGIYHDQSQLEEWKKTYTSKCMKLVLEGSDRNNTYGKKVFDRLLSLLLQSKKKFYFSSWDEEMYEYLSGVPSISDNILPFFKKIDVALDGTHPGPRSHAEWAGLVKEKIASMDRVS